MEYVETSDHIDTNDQSGKNELKYKLTMIDEFMEKFDMDLQGHEWNGKKGIFVYTGDCLVSSTMRNKILTFLKPFASNINLITGLESTEFSKMKWRTNTLINEITTSNRLDVPIENKRIVINKVMNTLKFIGGVILSSKPDMIKLMINTLNNIEDDGVRVN